MKKREKGFHQAREGKKGVVALRIAREPWRKGSIWGGGKKKTTRLPNVTTLRMCHNQLEKKNLGRISK